MIPELKHPQQKCRCQDIDTDAVFVSPDVVATLTTRAVPIETAQDLLGAVLARDDLLLRILQLPVIGPRNLPDSRPAPGEGLELLLRPDVLPLCHVWLGEIRVVADRNRQAADRPKRVLGPLRQVGDDHRLHQVEVLLELGRHVEAPAIPVLTKQTLLGHLLGGFHVGPSHVVGVTGSLVLGLDQNSIREFLELLGVLRLHLGAETKMLLFRSSMLVGTVLSGGHVLLLASAFRNLRIDPLDDDRRVDLFLPRHHRNSAGDGLDVPEVLELASLETGARIVLLAATDAAAIETFGSGHMTGLVAYAATN